MGKIERSFGRHFKQEIRNCVSYDYSRESISTLKKWKRENKNDKEMQIMINTELKERRGY